MREEYDKTPLNPPRPEPPPGAEQSPQINGLPAPPPASPAPTERVAPGSPPVLPGGDPIRAGEPAAARQAPAARKAKEAPPEIKDGFREIVETIVFVVVLVLLLKAFLAEAFVIPTGSMATTLLGYHRDATCPQCGYPFRVNMSNQLDPDRRSRPELVTGCTCPNCFLPFTLPVPEVRHP